MVSFVETIPFRSTHRRNCFGPVSIMALGNALSSWRRPCRRKKRRYWIHHAKTGLTLPKNYKNMRKNVSLSTGRVNLVPWSYTRTPIRTRVVTVTELRTSAHLRQRSQRTEVAGNQSAQFRYNSSFMWPKKLNNDIFRLNPFQILWNRFHATGFRGE